MIGLLAFFIALNNSCPAQSTKRSHYDSLGIMPPFQFYKLDGTAFTADSLNKQSPKYVLIYFKTSCEYCLAEFKFIKHNLSKFPHATFLLISRESPDKLKAYALDRQFEYFPQIHVLQDKEKRYRSYYELTVTPSIHIYDSTRKLLKYNEGMLDEGELLQFLKE